MTTIVAIKEYFGAKNSDNTQRAVENRELMELKKSMSNEQWQEFGKACAKALGQEWSPI